MKPVNDENIAGFVVAGGVGTTILTPEHHHLSRLTSICSSHPWSVITIFPLSAAFFKALVQLLCQVMERAF